MANKMRPIDVSRYQDIFPELDKPVYDDFHGVYTIKLGELIHDGLIKFTDGTWYKQLNGQAIDWYDNDQRARFWKKFEDHYFDREIGELPYLRWKRRLLNKLALIMPKYKVLYGLMDNDPNFLQVYDDYGKSRNIYSDFPQTMLSGNEDYASTGNDNQYERKRDGDFLDKYLDMLDRYDDLDLKLVREFDTNFYTVLSSNMNGF